MFVNRGGKKGILTVGFTLIFHCFAIELFILFLNEGPATFFNVTSFFLTGVPKNMFFFFQILTKPVEFLK